MPRQIQVENDQVRNLGAAAGYDLENFAAVYRDCQVVAYAVFLKRLANEIDVCRIVFSEQDAGRCLRTCPRHLSISHRVERLDIHCQTDSCCKQPYRGFCGQAARVSHNWA